MVRGWLEESQTEGQTFISAIAQKAPSIHATKNTQEGAASWGLPETVRACMQEVRRWIGPRCRKAFSKNH
jgi:hypothetical protein